MLQKGLKCKNLRFKKIQTFINLENCKNFIKNN